MSNSTLINQLSRLVQRTEDAIEYRPQHGLSVTDLGFKLNVFKNALVVIKNYGKTIKSGADLKHFKGIGNGIIRRIDTIMASGWLGEEYPDVPLRTTTSIPIPVLPIPAQHVPVQHVPAQPIPTQPAPVQPVKVQYVPVQSKPSVGMARPLQRSSENLVGLAQAITKLVDQNNVLIESLNRQHKYQVQMERNISKKKEKCNMLQLLYLMKDRENQETQKSLVNLTEILIKSNGSS